MIRAGIAFLLLAVSCPAWVESVEFPWRDIPKPLWERQLVWLKDAGIMHVSLPPASDFSDIQDLIRVVRRLGMEADLEGTVPGSLAPLMRAHGGPLTDPLPGPALRLSALAPDALIRAREALARGAPALTWFDVEDSLTPAGYKPGVVSFSGAGRPAAAILRRNALVSRLWTPAFASMKPLAGAGITRIEGAPVSAGPAVQQYGSDSGPSLVSVVNTAAKAWTGELRVMYAPAKRIIGIPAVTVPAKDALWLPVNIPLTAGPLCRNCSAFGNDEHLVYATAELTAMEYENGILAMEFAAPAAGEAILQLSREPSGPLVAGGRLAEFEWDEKTNRARLHIPAGSGADKHVRIGLAIEAPDATAFFESARVLMIGETNVLSAEFSSEAIAQRSRLRINPELPNVQDPGKEPNALQYRVTVPDTASSGDHAELTIEADGMQMSHARPELLHPAELILPDAVDLRVKPDVIIPVLPAVVSVNQRTGRELLISVKNNAPGIRTFVLEPKIEGVEFSPAKLEVTVGVSAMRDVSFRIFAKDAAAGLHSGEIRISGAAGSNTPFSLAVIPDRGAAAYSDAGFWFLENARFRASFMPGRWLEYVNKENNQNQLPAGGIAFDSRAIAVKDDALDLGGKLVRLEDLPALLPAVKR